MKNLYFIAWFVLSGVSVMATTHFMYREDIDARWALVGLLAALISGFLAGLRLYDYYK